MPSLFRHASLLLGIVLFFSTHIGAGQVYAQSSDRRVSTQEDIASLMQVLSTLQSRLTQFISTQSATAVTSSVFAQNTTVSGVKFSAGDKIKTILGIRVRRAPGGIALGSQTFGSAGTIVEGPEEASGYTWWKIDYDSGVDGWSVENWLIPLPQNIPDTNQDETQKTPDATCVCTQEYAPVCGVDGKTYGNACAARCENISIAYTDACEAQATPASSPAPTPVVPVEPKPPVETEQIQVKSVKKINDRGGRVAWYKGGHGLIAYDAIVNDRNKNTEIFTMNEDGDDVTCVTCDAREITKGFTGNPSWHPDGELIIFVAENENSSHTRFEHPSWGFNQDIWVIDKDGADPVRIWETPLHSSALHPHFSKDGRKIVFTERVPTGVKELGSLSPGGENHWNNWRIHIADFDLDTKTLSNHRTITPNGKGLYETNQFIDNDSRIVYAFTSNGLAYVDDVYTARLDGSDVKNYTKNSATWDEHGNFTKDESLFAFVSSRVVSDVVYPQATVLDAQLELYVQDMKGNTIQVSEMNKTRGDDLTRYLVADFDWNGTGDKIAFQVAPMKTGELQISPEVWVATLHIPNEAVQEPANRSTNTNNTGGSRYQTPSRPASLPAVSPSLGSLQRLNINRGLRVGISGSDVRALQEFLARDSSLYPEGIISGYYGTLTRQAIERFQCRYNIVCSGTPDATGFGLVGPRTRAILEQVNGR